MVTANPPRPEGVQGGSRLFRCRHAEIFVDLSVTVILDPVGRLPLKPPGRSSYLTLVGLRNKWYKDLRQVRHLHQDSRRNLEWLST